MASGNSKTPLAVGKIKDLTPTTRPRPLEVIVIHTWDVQVSTGDTLDFIVMDTDGDQIHGWIPRRLAPTHEPLLFENNIVCIKQFNVIEKRKKYYSPLKNPYNIVFTSQTKVEQISKPLQFPPQQFNFTEYDELKPLAGNPSYLTDVIGMFEFISPPKQITTAYTIREIYIRNERDETLKVTFWNEDMNLIPPTLNNNGATPIFAATYTAVSNYEGKIGVNASRATRVMLDPNIPKAEELRQSITTPSPGRPEKRLLPSELTRTTRDIRTALAKGTMGFNLCRATIQQVYEDEGWKYSSCPRCNRKVTLTGIDYKCYKCNTWEHTPNERYRLQLQIRDKYGLLDITAFGDTAAEILEVKLEDMNNIAKKPDTGEDEVHEKLMQIIGKEYLFRINITEYNINNPEKALTLYSISNVPNPPNKRMRLPQPASTTVSADHSQESSSTQPSLQTTTEASTGDSATTTNNH